MLFLIKILFDDSAALSWSGMKWSVLTVSLNYTTSKCNIYVKLWGYRQLPAVQNLQILANSQKIHVFTVDTRLTAYFMCGMMSDLVMCKFRKYGHTWHRMSLLRPSVIKQVKQNKRIFSWLKKNHQKSILKRTVWENLWYHALRTYRVWCLGVLVCCRIGKR